MLADDAASKSADRLVVASAVLELSTPAPPAALGAGGSSGAERITRLLLPGRPVRATVRSVGFALAIVVVLTPLILAIAPIVALAGATHCPVSEFLAR